MSIYFPESSADNDPRNKEYHDIVRRKALMQVRNIAKKVKNKTFDLDTALLTFTKPKKFTGPESAEVAYEKQYQDMRIYLQKELQADVNNLTTLQAFNAFKYLEKLHQEHKKRTKNGR